MTKADTNDIYFGLAYELAYFIHVNKETACFVAEDALDQLSAMLGKQGSYRKPPGLLSGFWKGGERSRPVRDATSANEVSCAARDKRRGAFQQMKSCGRPG